LAKIEFEETRMILRDMQPILNYPNPIQNMDLVYTSINSTLDFLFEAFKRDSQLAALLVKTTKIMESCFFLITDTLDKYRKDPRCVFCAGEGPRLRISNQGLITVFIDKALKILHVAMLHP
jgi:hypothetical protein